MSVEEDTELRDLVTQTLEVNGVLNRIRAELRANVFLALEEQDALQNKNVHNTALKSFLDTKEGQQAFSLVREFLQFFHLDFSLTVIDPESGYAGKATSRANLMNELNLHTAGNHTPLIADLIKRKCEWRSPPSSPRLGSRIPQRIQKADGGKPQKFAESKEKKNEEAFLGLDDADELLKDLGVSPISLNNTKKKPSWLDEDAFTKVTTKKGEDKRDNLGGGLGSLTNAPPLPGMTKTNKKDELGMLDVTSPEWDDLMKINTAMETKPPGKALHADSTSDAPENNYNYADDFQASSSHHSDEMSITEEIEDDLSIGSFIESKGDDAQTTDQTVSQISDGGYDYGEDAET